VTSLAASLVTTSGPPYGAVATAIDCSRLRATVNQVHGHASCSRSLLSTELTLLGQLKSESRGREPCVREPGVVGFCFAGGFVGRHSIGEVPYALCSRGSLALAAIAGVRVTRGLCPRV
jgi:hypothetical protein